MKYRILVLVVFIAVISTLGCRKKNEPPQSSADTNHLNTAESPRKLTEVERKIKRISESEELIQALTPDFKAIVNSFKTNSPGSILAVSPRIDYVGILPKEFSEMLDQAVAASQDPIIVSFEWPIAESASSSKFAKVLQPILAGQRFEDVQMGVLKAGFPEGSDRFEMETKLEGRIRLADGRLVGASGYQTLGWELDDQDRWKLVAWKQKKLKLVSAKTGVFEDVTTNAFPDDATREKLLSSSHQELIIKRSGEISATLSVKNARPGLEPFNDWESTGQFPAASVVDINGDGLDDLFVTDRWQSPQLLRNNGDGTFEDITAASGIEIPEFATCAYFVDFDNDGDSDLFVGFSLVASKFYVNENGIFKLHDAINEVLDETRFVVACSVADVNGDGLLDIYLSTYAFGSGPAATWINAATRPEERLKTRMKLERAHKYVDRVGPPNILLMNRGDTFEWVKIKDVLKQYRSTYQTAWMDFDRDGDPDLYLCNDFSPDVFLRNDTVRGDSEPTFVDVTQEIAPSMTMGFGMGASWGDYDGDGDLDLYVSNMYSKAGNRIIAQLDGVDERLQVSAHGNFLYENQGGKFKQVAGNESDQQHVATVGWSFGGQYADFDNDGQLDLYVPSGYYSAPQEISNDKDL